MVPYPRVERQCAHCSLSVRQRDRRNRFFFCHILHHMNIKEYIKEKEVALKRREISDRNLQIRINKIFREYKKICKLIDTYLKKRNQHP